MEVLGELEGASAAKVVVGALRDPECLVRVAAVEAVVALGPRIVAPLDELHRLVEDAEEVVRAYVGWALGRLGDEASARVLSRRHATETSAVADAGLLEGLFLLTGVEDHLRSLEEVLEAPDPQGRAFASNSLVGVASPSNVRRLIGRLETAILAERHDAIRAVLQANLEVLESMEATQDFELE